MKVEKYDFYALDTISLRSGFADSVNKLITDLEMSFTSFILWRDIGKCTEYFSKVSMCMIRLIYVCDYLAEIKLLKRRAYEEIVEYTTKFRVELKEYCEIYEGGYLYV